MLSQIGFRGLIAVSLFVQSTLLFVALIFKPSLADNQGFMVLATAVIVTGWVGGAIAYAYASGIDATKNSASLGKALDLAASNATAPEIPPKGGLDA